MKIRDLDFSDNPLNQEHEALGIPPIEQIPLHPVIRTAIWFAILTLIGLVALGAAQVFGSSWDEGVSTIKNTLNDPMFWNALLVGLLAQAVDGALGMAYGLTSTSFLLATGASPALAPAGYLQIVGATAHHPIHPARHERPRVRRRCSRFRLSPGHADAGYPRAIGVSSDLLILPTHAPPFRKHGRPVSRRRGSPRPPVCRTAHRGTLAPTRPTPSQYKAAPG